jgi:hypothetical protein
MPGLIGCFTVCCTNRVQHDTSRHLNIYLSTKTPLKMVLYIKQANPLLLSPLS